MPKILGRIEGCVPREEGRKEGIDIQRLEEDMLAIYHTLQIHALGFFFFDRRFVKTICFPNNVCLYYAY